MELKDVAAMHIPPAPGQAAAPAFSDEFADHGRRYALRHPSRTPYVIAGVVSAFWIGAAAAFAVGYIGVDGLLALDWPWLAGLFFAFAFPVAFVWFAAQISRRAQGLQMASADMMQIAARLVEPDAAAGREITRLGRAVRREIDALNTGLEGALIRVRTLETSIAEQMSAIEGTARTLEERGDSIRATLREERESLASFTHAMASDADRMGEHVRTRGQALRDLAKQASADVLAAQEQIDARAVTLRNALEASASAAHTNAHTADRGAAALIAAAEQLDGRLESFLQRGERQRGALAEAVSSLKAETQSLEQSLGRNIDALGGMGQALAEQTRRADTVASDIARRGEAVSGALGARAEAIAATFAGQVERLDSAAASAEARLKDAAAAAADAAEHVRAAFDMAARGATSASEHSGTVATSAVDAINVALQALGTKTQEARQAAMEAIAEFKAEADALPGLVAEKLKAMKAEELVAAAEPPPAEPEPEAAALPAPAIALTDGTQQSGKPEWFGFARKLAGLIRREPDAASASDWRLSTALANVDDRPLAPRAQQSQKTSVDLHREALHVVEKLQALAIDLDRALGDDPAPDLWRRYVGGERSVFTRRLVSTIGRDGADRIAQRYAADTDFRHHADRYMTEFEGLLDDAASRDRDQVLAETFLTSQTGRLYLLLAAATGRL
ncbi:hypothetical protein sos41_27660 [Alphaproteobacteria bacterium SO-S41]|nr:hypothetical protein sos41_27660 [Alphaproteobacteria bacterium SO-S41]